MDSMREEIEKLEKALRKAGGEVEILPKGHLRCSSSNGSDQYFIDGRYVSKKQIDYIRKVAQREYYEEIIPVLEHALSKLHAVENLYQKCDMENCYQLSCNARRRLVTPLFWPVEHEVEEFLAEQYSQGEFEENNRTEFYTGRGERVRSKSELLISERLDKYNVPYRYEKPVELRDRKRIIVCRPDFTVMNRRTGKVYLYEHLGRMDDRAYVMGSMHKLDLYEKNGYLIGKNMIITQETISSPLNIQKIDSYIKEFFI